MYCPICGSQSVTKVGNENAPDSIGLAVMSMYPDDDYEGYDFEIDRFQCDISSCKYIWYMKPPINTNLKCDLTS